MWATASAGNGASASTSFAVDGSYPLRPQEGDWPVFEVPAGLVLDNSLFLPVVLR